jgi:hypothetical protein
MTGDDGEDEALLQRDVSGLQSVEVRRVTDQGPFMLSLQLADFTVGTIICRHATFDSVARDLEKLAASLRRKGEMCRQAPRVAVPASH